jgi:hypothetical protein
MRARAMCVYPKLYLFVMIVIIRLAVSYPRYDFAVEAYDHTYVFTHSKE